jgi:hypothetical protein
VKVKKFKESDFDRLIPVQIVGTQRSGSNLLRLMLNQLNSVFAPHPPHILTTFYKILEYYGDLEEDPNFHELVSDICEFVRLNPVPWRNDSLDPTQVITHCRERSLFEIYRKLYEINALSHKARYWFNKSMQNVYYIDEFTRKDFHPFIIHLVRDGRDVALSFKNAIVGDKHVYHLAKKWKEDQEISSYFVREFGPQRAITIKYEDLLLDPENEIKKICSLLNIEYSEKILKYYESEESLITATSGKMWSNLTQPIIQNNFNKYKKGLKKEEIVLFERIAGFILQDYGYTLENQFPTRNLTFSSEDIDRFELENKRLKELFIRQASPLDLLKRKAQNELLQRIYDRKMISLSL